jgi:hypothetical protein
VSPNKVITTTDASGTRAITHQDKLRSWMQVIISLIVLVTGILLLIDPRWMPQVDENTKKIASGWIGAVIGYWLS